MDDNAAKLCTCDIHVHVILLLYKHVCLHFAQALKLLHAFPLDTKMKDGCELAKLNELICQGTYFFLLFVFSSPVLAVPQTTP